MNLEALQAAIEARDFPTIDALIHEAAVERVNELDGPNSPDYDNLIDMETEALYAQHVPSWL